MMTLKEHPDSRCLVMTFGAQGVGDHITCSPVIRNLSKSRPSYRIDLGVFSPIGRELFKHHPHIHRIHLLDMDYLKLGGKYRIREKIDYIRSFRQEHYDRVYILGSKFRHAVFSRLIGARERIGFNTYHRGFLLTVTSPEPTDKNMVERFLDIIRMDGIEIENPYLDIFLTESEHNAADNFLRSCGVSHNEKVLVMAPFAADMRRTWGLTRFWEIGRIFAQLHGYKVIVLGSRKDEAFLHEEPIPLNPSIINAVGKMTILEAAAIIKRGRLFLGNDSGLGHLAGAVGTSSLVLGYHITRSWYPMSRSVQTLIKDTRCDRCTVHTCPKITNGKPECFVSITIEEVVEALREMDRNI